MPKTRRTPRDHRDKELHNLKDKLLRQKEEIWQEIMDDLEREAGEE